MKRIACVMTLLAGAAQAGPEQAMNPMALLAPMMQGGGYPGYAAPQGNPFAGNPFAGNLFQGNPFAANPYAGSPFGGMPGFSGNPLTSNPLATLQALNALGMLAAPLAPVLFGPAGQVAQPALQMAPNMMSHGHYMQYGGGPFGGNPYLKPSMPNPLSPPAFSPSMPSMPFSSAQGTWPLPGNAPNAAPFVMPFSAPSPAPGMLPGLTPAYAAPQAAGGTPWSPAPAPQASMPAFPFMAQPAAPAPQPAPQAQPSPAAPMDPSLFLQLLMRPVAPASPEATPEAREAAPAAR